MQDINTQSLDQHPIDPRLIDRRPRNEAQREFHDHILFQQCKEVQTIPHNIGWVTCPCGKRPHISHAYKCLYCGLWLCQTCAKRHFAGPLERLWLWFSSTVSKFYRSL